MFIENFPILISVNMRQFFIGILTDVLVNIVNNLFA